MIEFNLVVNGTVTIYHIPFPLAVQYRTRTFLLYSVHMYCLCLFMPGPNCAW